MVSFIFVILSHCPWHVEARKDGSSIKSLAPIDQTLLLATGAALAILSTLYLATACCTPKEQHTVQPLGRETLKRLKDTKINGHPRLQNALHDMFQAYAKKQENYMVSEDVVRMIKEVCTVNPGQVAQNLKKAEVDRLVGKLFPDLDGNMDKKISEVEFLSWAEITLRDIEKLKEDMLVAFPIYNTFLCGLASTIRMQIVGCGPFPVDEGFTSRPMITLSV